MSDYYNIIGVSRDASQNEIKKAYRKVAMKYHPDKNPGDSSAETKFKEAANAYAVLSDEQKKARYDQYGEAGVDNQGFGGGAGFGDINDIFSAFGDIFGGGGGGGFGDIFGGGRTRQQRQQTRGSDLKISIPLTLEEIYTGVKKTVKIKRFEKCDDCSGSGAKHGSKPITCSVCHGTGEIRQVQRSMFGQVVQVQPCYQCQGEGKIISNPCGTCRGNGRVKKSSSVEFDVPAGVSAGNYMTKRGSGNIGPRGAVSGNLIIYFDEIEHELLLRDGNDIFLDVWIQLPQAISGDSIEVPTLSGNVKLKIPIGIKSGQVLRLRGKGFPEINSHRTGDLLVKVNISTPQKLNKKAKQLIKELTNELDMYPKFKKMK
jgi:molecular chaperone DnaJ